MHTQYETIAAPVETEIEISRSRFLTRLARVSTEEEARDEIARVRAEHPKARHHCTAYVLGADSRVQRSNDDGEPGGTAGAPMLDALIAADLSDVVAIVTRYFGGVLLGAGGLTRAYRASVAEATAVAKRVVRALRHEMFVIAGYEMAPQIESEMRRQGIFVSGSDYTEVVTLKLMVAADQIESVHATAAELSSGEALVTVGGSGFVDL